MLPCILADGDARLIRVSGPEPSFLTPIWVAGHRELADTSRMRRLRRDLVAVLATRAPRFLGRL